MSTTNTKTPTKKTKQVDFSTKPQKTHLSKWQRLISFLKRYFHKFKKTVILHTFRNTPLKPYKGIKELPILIFWEILQESNIYLLNKNHHEKNLYTRKQQQSLFLLWQNTFDEYFQASNNQEQKHLSKQSFMQILETHKFNSLLSIYNAYLFVINNNDVSEKSKHDYGKTIFKVFKSNGFKQEWTEDNPEKNIEILQRYISSVTNRIRKNREVNIEQTKKEVSNIYDSVIYMEQVLERSLPHIDKITVMQWIAYEKLAKEIIREKTKLSEKS